MNKRAFYPVSPVSPAKTERDSAPRSWGARSDAHAQVDTADVVALVLRQCADVLRAHDVIVRVDVADGATSLLDDGVGAVDVLATVLQNACAESPAFGQLVICSRLLVDHVELVITVHSADVDGSSVAMCFRLANPPRGEREP